MVAEKVSKNCKRKNEAPMAIIIMYRTEKLNRTGQLLLRSKASTPFEMGVFFIIFVRLLLRSIDHILFLFYGFFFVQLFRLELIAFGWGVLLACGWMEIEPVVVETIVYRFCTNRMFAIDSSSKFLYFGLVRCGALVRYENVENFVEYPK